MNVVEKRRLSKEAGQQINALKKISRWRTIAIAVSTIGVALAYAGIAGTDQNLFFGIFGIILAIVSIGCAVFINLGLKNGRRNVEKILNVLGEKAYEI